MMALHRITLSTLLATCALSSAAFAGELTIINTMDTTVMPPVTATPGYIGLSIAYGDAIDEGYPINSGTLGIIDGAYSFRLGQNLAVIEGEIMLDDYSGSGSSEPSDLSFQIGAHYLAGLANGMTVGGFAAYADAPHDNGNPTLNYQVVLGGAEVIKPLGNNFTLFGQAGYGTSLELSNDHTGGPLDSAGFYNGWFARAGASYTGFGDTIITLDMEYAETAEYEDDTEPGVMWTAALGGLTPLAMDGRLVASYEARYGFFDALNDSDQAEETTLSIGVRYMLGGSSSQDLLDAGMIGLPYLPLRASMWTPYMN